MIRTLSVDALDACAALYVDTFNGPPWNESWTAGDAAQRLGDFITTPRAHGVCCLGGDGELLGFAVGHLERSGAEDHFLLQEMCVGADARRQGIGSRLLEALEGRLGARRQWYLLTARDSDASAFYESRGFRPADLMGVFVRP